MSIFTDVFDVLTPPGTGESRRLGDDRMREIKRAILERLLVEHSFPTGSGSGSGRHKFGIGNTAARPSDPVAGSIYINTQTLMLEYYTGAAWATVCPAYLLLTGGTLSGTLLLNNNLRYQIKDSGGVARTVAWMSGTNHLIVGDQTNCQVDFQSSGNPTMAVAGILGGLASKLWWEGNDGSGSGLDADLLKGVNLTYLASAASAGYLYFGPTGTPFLQWGSNSVAGGGTSNVALPTSYATSHFQAFGSFATHVSDRFENAIVTPNGLTQVQLLNLTDTAQTIRWISVGA